MKTTVNVRLVGADPGNCKLLYRTEKGTLICRIPDGWYSCEDDDTWNEPGFKLDGNYINIIEEPEA